MKTTKTIDKENVVGHVGYNDGFVSTSYNIFSFNGKDYVYNVLFDSYIELDDYMDMYWPFVEVYFF